MPNGPGSHHGQAAYHHESATRHHRAAELAYDSGDHKRAAHEAQAAAGHTMLAKQLGDLAARSHLEHYGMQPGISPKPVAKKRVAKKPAAKKTAMKKPAAKKGQVAKSK
jgi:hypothetical protein